MITSTALESHILTTVGDILPEVLQSLHLDPVYCFNNIIYVSEVVAKYVTDTHPTAPFLDYVITGTKRELVLVPIGELQ